MFVEGRHPMELISGIKKTNRCHKLFTYRRKFAKSAMALLMRSAASAVAFSSLHARTPTLAANP
jgi:hypothetical protein